MTDPAALPEEHKAAIREKLGLDQCAWLVVGAAPTPVEVLEYFDALGLPICELWGMSETSSCATINPPGSHQDRHVRAAPEGRRAEARRRRRAARARRHRDEGLPQRPREDGARRSTPTAGCTPATSREIDDDGYVKIVDRKKELIINAAGKNMSPVNIESRLKTCHPLIGTAVAIGDRRPYNVALIVLDPDACGAFAKEHGIEDASPAGAGARRAGAGGDRGGDRGGQHPPLAGRADQEVVPAGDRVAARRRGADADDEAEAPPDRARSTPREIDGLYDG